jgi:hypothetical protein|tara:strand:+ start:540 stop:761 length:222 start_codon:yes stop_codon:yes gene_type:complete
MGGVARVISPPKPPAPPAPVYTPAPTKAEVSQATSTDASGMLRGKGRSSTILTGAKGLGDNALTTTKKSLLGG